MVTIEFFRLDDVDERKNPVQERTTVISLLPTRMEKLAGSATAEEEKIAQEFIDARTSPKAPHANCARSYITLFETDHAEALQVYDLAFKLIASTS